MISNEIISYLDDESKSIDKKLELVKRCELGYSEIFELMDRYNDSNLYPALHSLVYYGDSRLANNIEKNARKRKNKVKEKSMRHVKRRGL